MDQAERCTSYPEYQCFPADLPLTKTAAKHSSKEVVKTTSDAQNAVAVSAPVAPDTSTQASGTK
jgi:hypothetical protein